MLNEPQGTTEIVINATQEEIWRILEDSQRLCEWVPMVKRTSAKLESRYAVRQCDVRFGNRVGQVTERCVVFDRPHRIGWIMIDETLGFSRLIADFGFDFALSSITPQGTSVAASSYYRPTGLFGRIMVSLVLRRRFRNTRLTILTNLKRLIEKGI